MLAARTYLCNFAGTHLLVWIMVIGCDQVYAQNSISDQLEKLKAAITDSEKYDEQKQITIDEHYQNFRDESFESYLKLYDDYVLFRGDSAFWYSKKALEKALELEDQSLISYARMKVAFVLLSSGLLKEAFDSLSLIRSFHLDNYKKAEYYSIMARYYYDLADYTLDDYYRPRYNHTAGLYLDSAIVLYPANTFEHDYYEGLRNLRVLNFDKASEYLKRLLKRTGLSHHELALSASTLSDIFIRKGQTDSAISLLSAAAIADVESSTKETSAIFNLATLLFRQGDLEHASVFIQKAATDANFYGSRQRKTQLSVIMPLIKEKEVRELESEKKNLFTYATIVTISFASLIALTTIIFGQITKLKKQQKIIGQKNNSLQHLVEEKEWLLKEVHHRVKNNLQTVLSLLESQARHLSNEALYAIQDSRNRVYAMSLIHKKLYESTGVAAIDMPEYLRELIQHVRESSGDNNHIIFQMNFERVAFDVSQAVPIGLIVNEAITNSIKHAFPDKTEGSQISISLSQAASKVELCISDNGKGLPETYESMEGASGLGLKLMKGLTEDIEGRFTMKSGPGLMIRISFIANIPLQNIGGRSTQQPA